MSLFGLLNLGANGMNASTFGANVASHNASNVGTPGYTRRIADLEPLGQSLYGGNGARAVGARRVMDQYIDRRILGGRSLVGETAGRTRTIEVLDEVLADGPGSLGEAIDSFEAAVADLPAHPGDRGARQVLLDRAEQLARIFRTAANSIDMARIDANLQLEDEVSDLNGKLEEIASLSAQISRFEIAGTPASDLRDRRDLLIREVADYVPVTAIEDSSGRMGVYLDGGQPLVTADGQVRPLEAVADANGDIQIFMEQAGADVNITSLIRSGSIGGTIDARDGTLAQAADDIDQLAFDLVAAYNAVHSGGFGLDGLDGRNLFEPIGAVSGAASAMALSADVAGQPDFIAVATDAAAVPGDNRNALALQALATSTIALGGTTDASGALAAAMGTLGSNLQSAKAAQTQAVSASEQLVNIRESVSGVALDEEMITLMKFQRGYQASLQVVQIADQMLGDLLELLR